MSKISNELMKLILTVDRNERAYDDDLSESWRELISQWNKVKKLMEIKTYDGVSNEHNG